MTLLSAGRDTVIDLRGATQFLNTTVFIYIQTLFLISYTKVYFSLLKQLNSEFCFTKKIFFKIQYSFKFFNKLLNTFECCKFNWFCFTLLLDVFLRQKCMPLQCAIEDYERVLMPLKLPIVFTFVAFYHQILKLTPLLNVKQDLLGGFIAQRRRSTDTKHFCSWLNQQFDLATSSTSHSFQQYNLFNFLSL